MTILPPQQQSSLSVKETSLQGVKLVTPYIFEDFRGEYVETYNEQDYYNAGIRVHFVQDDISVSRLNVLRGIHGDQETCKLVSCLHGSFYLVVVNCDNESDEFGKWEAFTLSEKNRMQVLIPPKFGNAHLALTENVIFHYKQNTYYNPKGQFTYRYDDSRFKIWWPINNPIISKRDAIGKIC